MDNVIELSGNTLKVARNTQEFGERMLSHIKNSKRVSATVTEEVLELFLQTNKSNIELIEMLLNKKRESI